MTASSSAESENHRFLSSRQAITCAGTYQRLQGRRVAVDTAIWHRKVRDNGRRYGREHRPADRWAPGPARLLFLPSYCRRSAPTLRSGSPRAASCRLKTRAHWRERTTADEATPAADGEANSEILLLPDNCRDPELTKSLRDAQKKYFAGKRQRR